MLQPYLQDKDVIHHLNSAKKALIGETITQVIFLDEDTDLYILESGNSYLHTKQGQTSILSQQKTKDTLRAYKEQNSSVIENMNAINPILNEQESQQTQ